MTLLKRRPDPPIFNDYRQYKPHLREDFLYACVYCTIHENEFGGPRNFDVEHFRPKSKFEALVTVYTNLLYACGVCNSFKKDDWPSNDPVNDGKGYLDPCEHDYDNHFIQTDDFQIQGLSKVAQYIIERLHLNRPQLQKLRQRRRREEELYHKSMQLYRERLLEIDTLLGKQELPDSVYGFLQEFRKNILAEQIATQESWQKRWNPLVGLEDYR